MADNTALLDCTTSGAHCKGLLGLSPELILEISSHILSSHELRETRRNLSYVQDQRISVSPLIPRQHDLANLRLVCRYLGAVLQRETFKSLVFNLHVTRWDSADDVESNLHLFARGGTPSSFQARFLYIKCIEPTREGYDFEHPRRRWFRKYDLDQDEKLRAKAESIERSISINLERAILSFQNLRCVQWDIKEIDALSISIMNALSSLPSLEDLALFLSLNLGFESNQLGALGIDRFHDLRSIVVAMSNIHHNKNGPGLAHHISIAISRSPSLNHLSVLQDGVPSSTSLEMLLKNVPQEQTLHSLQSLQFTLQNIESKNFPVVLHHLRALKRINIVGCIDALDHSGPSLWKNLMTAKIWLEDITVSYLSDPLLTYLASYSGLQRLEISLLHTSSADRIHCDIEGTFINNILPLHSLSLVLPPTTTIADSCDLATIPEGLIFEVGRKYMFTPVWNFKVCIDTGPVGLSLLLRCSTQTLEYHSERLNIKVSSTMKRFRCGTGRMGYAVRQREAVRQWFSQLKVPEEDVAHYPHTIDFNHTTYDLQPGDEEDFYIYQLSASELNY